jgi:hypothetical protein
MFCGVDTLNLNLFSHPLQSNYVRKIPFVPFTRKILIVGVMLLFVIHKFTVQGRYVPVRYVPLCLLPVRNIPVCYVLAFLRPRMFHP